jgi:hypothetical protein
VADEPTNRELENLIKRNHADSREAMADLKNHVDAQFRLYLLREVYEAREAAAALREKAQDDRMDRMEADQENDRRETASSHKTNRTLFWTVAGGMCASLLTVVLSTWFSHGGVH